MIPLVDVVQQSPVSIMDTAAFDEHRGLKERCLPPSLALIAPTLDSLTASGTTTEGDSISSISTEQLDEEEQEGTSKIIHQKKRSIFGDYWNKSGAEPVVLQRRGQSAASLEAGNDQEIQECFPSREVLKAVAAPPLSSPSASRRRSIFGEFKENKTSESMLFKASLSDSVRSCPAIVLTAAAPACPPLAVDRPTLLNGARKARSASSLLDRPSSILRSKETRPRRRSSSVSFDDKVEVVVFETPKESWSQQGWALFFS